MLYKSHKNKMILDPWRWDW